MAEPLNWLTVPPPPLEKNSFEPPFFYFDVFTYLTYSPAHFLTPFPHKANGLFARQQAVEAAGESDLASKLSRDYQEKQVYLLTPLLFCVFTLRNCIFCD